MLVKLQIFKISRTNFASMLDLFRVFSIEVFTRGIILAEKNSICPVFAKLKILWKRCGPRSWTFSPTLTPRFSLNASERFRIKT